MNIPTSSWYRTLLSNSRFWILAIAVSGSVLIAGWIQFLIPGNSLQTIRIEQTYGFVSMGLLYAALFITPLTSCIPSLPGRDGLLHARRAIGVSAFYFAALHAVVGFFGQLDGFAGLSYLSGSYAWSLALGITALALLNLLALTSFDRVVAMMGRKWWKRLHRTIYAAAFLILLHVLLIGTHFDGTVTLLGIITYSLTVVLIGFEIWRIIRKARRV